MKIKSSYYKNIIAFISGLAVTSALGIVFTLQFFSTVYFTHPKNGLSFEHPSTMHMSINDYGVILTWDEYAPNRPSEIKFYSENASLENLLQYQNETLSLFNKPLLQKIYSNKWDEYYRSNYYEGDYQGTTILLRENDVNYVIQFIYNPDSEKNQITDFERIFNSLRIKNVNGIS